MNIQFIIIWIKVKIACDLENEDFGNMVKIMVAKMRTYLLKLYKDWVINDDKDSSQFVNIRFTNVQAESYFSYVKRNIY